MKKVFLLIYAGLLTVVTVLFLIFGERKDPRFYVTILFFTIVGKIISRWIDSRE